MERQPHIRNVTLTRRGFTAGVCAVASAAVLGVMSNEAVKYQTAHDTETDIPATEVAPESEPAFPQSKSKYFNRAIADKKESLARDDEVAIAQLGLVLLIQDNFSVPAIDREIVRNNIEGMMPALAFVESRFDSEAESDEKAFGIMQILPSVWKELSVLGEDPAVLAYQVKVAARLMEQSYQHIVHTCTIELDFIELVFFAGDSTAFQNCFLTPLILNAYNAGMGTITKIVQNFVDQFPEPQSLRALAQGKADLTDFDVFFAMTHVATAEGWGKIYKNHAQAYTPTLYAANDVLVETYRKIVNHADADDAV